MLVEIIYYKNKVYYFYGEKVKIKQGFFSKTETEFSFMGVSKVKLEQTFLGRMFNFADIRVYIPGRDYPIKLTGVSKPNELKEYLSSRIVTKNDAHTIAIM